MTPENFATALRIFSRRCPFKPYAIEFTSGTRIIVDHPEAVDIRDTLVVHRDTKSAYTVFDSGSVARFVEEFEQELHLPESDEGA